MINIQQIGETEVNNNNPWTAKSYFNIVGGPHDGRQLKVITEYAKHSLLFNIGLGLYTISQVMTIEKKEGWQSETFTVFEDPCKTLVRPVQCRATEKKVREQHEEAIRILNEDLDWLK